jgi:hypothetical protein
MGKEDIPLIRALGEVEGKSLMKELKCQEIIELFLNYMVDKVLKVSTKKMMK